MLQICALSALVGLRDTQVPEGSTKEQSAQYPAKGEEAKEVPRLSRNGIQTNTETPLVKPSTAAAQPKQHGLHPRKNWRWYRDWQWGDTDSKNSSETEKM